MKCWRCGSENITNIGTMERMNPAKWNEVVESFNLYECDDCKMWFDEWDMEGVETDGEE